MNVPDGFGTVTPYVLVDGVDTYARFLQNAFAAAEISRSVLPDGRIANCQIRFSGTTIMLGEASEVFPASRAAFYLFVSDADAAGGTCRCGPGHGRRRHALWRQAGRRARSCRDALVGVTTHDDRALCSAGRNGVVSRTEFEITIVPFREFLHG